MRILILFYNLQKRKEKQCNLYSKSSAHITHHNYHGATSFTVHTYIMLKKKKNDDDTKVTHLEKKSCVKKLNIILTF